ncbi:MAG: hypothetical protein MK411_10645, partial [SAR202 cluster bacterium]|nr:hypothetical protein [SAR202 cluster bacterium]
MKATRTGDIDPTGYIDLIHLSTPSCDHGVVFKLILIYMQAKYEENMTEASSKGVMRLKPIMFLFV